MLVGVLFLFKRYLPSGGPWPLLHVALGLAPLLLWILHLIVTANFTVTLVLLDSETSLTAERTYEGRFKKQVRTLDQAVRLSIDPSQAPNVRFYAACLVAERLATNSEVFIGRVLRKVENTPLIETQFFDGNHLTEKFYIPGHFHPPLSVQKIVEERLRDLRKSAKHE